MKFIHEPVDLGYSDLVTETSSSARLYSLPNGKKLPSITSVLSILSEDSIREWRAKVGEEEANKVSRRASMRGTAVHSTIEKYLNNDETYLDTVNHVVRKNFNDLKPILDSRIGKIILQEAPLYSEHLGIAGRVDCIAEFDGVISVIDFKTSRRTKTKENIEGYFIQESAYAIMFEERTGIPIVNLVTIISVDDEEPQVFVEHRDNWTKKLIATIQEYNRRKIFNR